MTVEQAWDRVSELARERPEWLPILKAACEQAEESEPYGGRFAGRWVLEKVGHWAPGLRVLVGYGLLEKSGESTRQGRRAYYRMPDWREVKEAVRRLERLDLGKGVPAPDEQPRPAERPTWGPFRRRDPAAEGEAQEGRGQ
jgi:hypothetical protein